MTAFLCILLIIVCSSFIVPGSGQPARVSTVVLTSETVGTCPSQQLLNDSKENLKENITDILQDTPIGYCPCGGPGAWTRIAHLNMSDPSQQCPPNWSLITTPVRGCRQNSIGCDSAFFPSNGLSYSRVCGRVIAYQGSSPNAFEPYIQSMALTLEQGYLDGISLTHGVAGSRQHIWSFVAAYSQAATTTRWTCPCTNSQRTWPHTVPPFIQNNYFCDTGIVNYTSGVHSSNPLWDGQGCGSTNTCCKFNNPPWFCTTLPQPTTDDIEVRMCHDQEINNEHVLIFLLDIFVKN